MKSALFARSARHPRSEVHTLSFRVDALRAASLLHWAALVMNKAFLVLVLSFPLATFGCAATTDASSDGSSDNEEADLKKDACATPARNAAEAEYGNSPDGTHVKVLTKGKKYRVTVGINNPEDGPHDYYVTFAGSCSSTPTVTEVPWFPHPLRDAAHVAYDAIFSANSNEMSSANAIAASALPSAARRQMSTWNDPAHSTCTAVEAYAVRVHGQDTFAVTCDVAHDSIKTHIAIWDASGADVDQAAIYHSNDVGTNGVSWQNETFLQQD